MQNCNQLNNNNQRLFMFANYSLVSSLSKNYMTAIMHPSHTSIRSISHLGLNSFTIRFMRVCCAKILIEAKYILKVEVLLVIHMFLWDKCAKMFQMLS